MSMEPDAFLEQQYEERTHVPDDFWDSEDADLDDDEDFHDTGFSVVNFNGDIRANCECGWSGTVTCSSKVAADEADAHRAAMGVS